MPRYTDIALGAGAVLAVGLGLLALQPEQLPSDEEGRSATRTTAPPSPSKATASASVEPTEAPPSADLPTAWVVGVGDGIVVRAARGDCDAATPATLTVVAAGGEAVSRDVEGLASVGGIEVTDGASVRLVGVDAECERVGFGTTDAGRSWQRLDTVPAVWSVVPGSDDEIHAPSGQVEVPCEPLSVTGLDAKVARLACTDGRIMGTVSGGDEWSILGNNDEVQAVGFVSATTAVALVEHDDCEGISVDRSTDGGTDFEASYCVEGAGPWGLVTRGDSVAVVGRDVLARSDDDGDSWDLVELRQ